MEPNKFSPQNTRDVIVGHLTTAGMRNLHSTDTDFQFGDDRSFKISVGTSYGEVAVHFHRDGKWDVRETRRVTMPRQIPEVLDIIDVEIEKHKAKQGYIATAHYHQAEEGTL